jgi:hypothetical protein
MFFQQKELRYVIERAGSMEYDVYRVVDTIEEVFKVIGHIDEDFQDEWEEFINLKTKVFKDDDNWKVTRCDKSC